MVEQIGSGIGRIRNEIEKSGLPSPEFITEGMFTVTFKRPEKDFHKDNFEETREETREKIIRLIKENNKITTIELASEIGISEKGIEYHLKKLKSGNILKRIGSTKDGQWKIIE